MVATDARAASPPPGRHRGTTPLPEAERGFRPDIQGLRAIAVSLVVVYHLYPKRLPGGYVGVDIFFVISGFLITGHLARSLGRRGRVGLVDFYARRARRLMPAAVLVLVVTWLASLYALPSTRLPAAAEQVRASALYFQNWILARDSVSYLKSDDAASPVQHFWSLSVEEQFYVVWPLLFLLAAGVGVLAVRTRRVTAERRGPTAVHVMLGLAVVVLAASLWYSDHYTAENAPAAYFVTTTRMWELAVGGVLALLPATASAFLGRLGPLAWVGLAMMIFSAFHITGASAFPGTIALLPVGGAALMIACGSGAARFGPGALMSVRSMVFLGDISYSLYLWHWPVIVLWKAYSDGGIGRLDGPVIVVASVVAAWFTKVFVEDRFRLAPFIAKNKWRSLATVVLAIVPVVMTTVWLSNQPGPYRVAVDAKHPGGAVLAGDVKKLPSASYVPTAAQAENDGSVYASGPGGCQSVQRSVRTTPCTYGDTTNPTRTIALIGDSVAGQWFTPLNAIAKQRHWKIVMSLHSLCPWTSTMTQMPGSDTPYTACHTWGQAVLKNLLATKPDVVITSARPSLGTPTHRKPGAAAFASIGTGSADYWSQLIRAGIPVVALRESPEMGKNIPDCLAGRDGSIASCSTSVAKAVLPDTPLEVAAAKTGKGAHLVDMNDLICGRTTCAPVVGNVLVYRDKHHLTRTYTVTLQPYLQQRLLATGVFG